MAAGLGDLMGLGGGFTTTLSKLAEVGWLIFEMLLIFGGIGIVLYYTVFRNKIFPIKAIILEKRGDGYRTTSDRLKRVKTHEGLEKYIFMRKRKDTLPPLDYDNINIDNTVYLYKYANGSYIPLKPTQEFNKVGLMPVEIDIKNWHAMEAREAANRLLKQSFWEKYQAMISVALLGGIFLVGLILILGQVEHVMNVASAATTKCSTFQPAAGGGL